MSFLPNNALNGDKKQNNSPLPRKNNHRIHHGLQYQPGNHNDFTLVFNVLYNQLCYYSNKFVSDWDAAEDIVVEVFIKFWCQKGTFNNAGAIKRWLYKCTHNDSLHYLKRLKNRSTSNIDFALTVPDETNKLSEIINAEQFSEICSLINTLPTECRKIIRLHYLVGLDNAQIAAMFNVSIHTVKNQRARGIYLIRKRMRIYQN
jgi:RNA polymerase sigma-70 factor (family 1)